MRKDLFPLTPIPMIVMVWVASSQVSADERLIEPNSSRLGPGMTRRQTPPSACPRPELVQCQNANFCCLPEQTCQPKNLLGGTNGWCCPAWALQCNGLACCDGSTTFCCGSSCCQTGWSCIKDKYTKPRPTSTQPYTPSFTPSGIYTPTPKTVSPTSGVINPSETRIPVGTINLDYTKLVYGSRQLSSDLQSQRQQAVTDLFEGICKGLGSADSIILTFSDDPSTRKTSLQRSICGGSSNPCSGNPSKPVCMQFPFAITTDATANSTWNCASPLAQYIQGAILFSFRNSSSISNGQAFQITLSSFNCITLSPDPSTGLGVGVSGSSHHDLRRDLAADGSDSSIESFPPFTAQDTLSTVINQLGDLFPGTYVITTNVSSGSISNLRVVDANGIQYGSASDSSSFSSGQSPFNFTLSELVTGVGYLMSTPDTVVNISYTSHPITGIRTDDASTLRAQVTVSTILLIVLSLVGAYIL